MQNFFAIIILGLIVTACFNGFYDPQNRTVGEVLSEFHSLSKQ